jgi:hypothetical protein
MNKAYTIGRTRSYDLGLTEPKGLCKLGLRGPNSYDCPDCPEGYPGGWVWKTIEEADNFRKDRLNQFEPNWNPEEFSVYEIQLTAGWEVDVSETNDGFNNLLVDSKIIKKAI